MNKAIMIILVIIILLLMINVKGLQKDNTEMKMQHSYENGLKISGEFNDNYC